MTNKSILRLLAFIFVIVIVFSTVSCVYITTPTSTSTSTSALTSVPTSAFTSAPTADPTKEPTDPTDTSTEHSSDVPTENDSQQSTEDVPTENNTQQPTEDITPIPNEIPALTRPAFTVPEYSGEEYCIVNEGVPSFTENQIVAQSYEFYSELDGLGRCGTAVACLGKDLMPTDKRGSISSIYPSGWYTYKDKDENTIRIYERSHLLGWQLTGENANPKNLITGTYDLNGVMQTFEDMITAYIKETDNHVMYRVIPIFEGDNLLCSGVIMEAYSVEDKGEGISFNIYIFNVEPDYDIDYATGEFKLSEDSILNQITYVINKNKHKYHKPTCSAVADMKESNKIFYYGTKDELLEEYPDANPCGSCKP